MRRTIWIIGIIVVVLLVAMQFRRPDFDRQSVDAAATLQAQLHPPAQVAEMLRRSCANCHSAQGEIPWYGHVWPSSVLLQNDIRQARGRFDLSTWGNLSPEMSRIRLLNACAAMRSSDMPLWYYRPMHPGSAPKPDEVEAFCAWAQAQPVGRNLAWLQ